MTYLSYWLPAEIQKNTCNQEDSSDKTKLAQNSCVHITMIVYQSGYFHKDLAVLKHLALSILHIAKQNSSLYILKEGKTCVSHLD